MTLRSPLGVPAARVPFLHRIPGEVKFQLEVCRPLSQSEKTAEAGAPGPASRSVYAFLFTSLYYEYEMLFGTVRAPALTRLESKSLAIAVIHSV